MQLQDRQDVAAGCASTFGKYDPAHGSGYKRKVSPTGKKTFCFFILGGGALNLGSCSPLGAPLLHAPRGGEQGPLCGGATNTGHPLKRPKWEANTTPLSKQY